MSRSPVNPRISLVNKSSMDNADLVKLAAALQKQVDRDVGPAWGVGCSLAIRSSIKKGEWGLLFVDEPDVPDALGYHDLTKDGLPLGKVFVEFTLNHGERPSVTASHEILEMLIDPAIQMGAVDDNNTWWAYEVCDACQREEYAIKGVMVSNFVYPTWFESFWKPNATRFDHLRTITKPFQVRPGGYMPIFRDGNWQQVYGSKQAAALYKAKPHPRGQCRGRVMKKSRVA